MRDTLPSSAASRAPAPAEGSRKGLVRRVLGSLKKTDPPPPGANGELPQFPGVVFGARGIDLDGNAEHNEAATRASLVYFKHRWLGEAVALEGSDAFRLKVWAIADELGVPLQGPLRGSGMTALHRQAT